MKNLSLKRIFVFHSKYKNFTKKKTSANIFFLVIGVLSAKNEQLKRVFYEVLLGNF